MTALIKEKKHKGAQLVKFLPVNNLGILGMYMCLAFSGEANFKIG